MRSSSVSIAALRTGNFLPSEPCIVAGKTMPRKRSKTVFLVVLIIEDNIVVPTNKISKKNVHVGRLVRQRRNTQTRIRHSLENRDNNNDQSMFHGED